MDCINKSNHIFSSLPLEDVLAFYSNPSAYPELEEKIFSDYLTDPKYLETCQTHSIHSNLIKNNFKIYYKLTKYDFKSRGFEYKLGLNIDTNPFNPSGCCSGGGLYFCELENLHQFEKHGNYLTPIIVPHDIPMYKETHTDSCKHTANTYEKLKAPCIYVLPRVRIDNPVVNKFICQASPLNTRFISCMLHSSDNIADLKEFTSYSNDKYFWYKQSRNAHIKISIDEYLKSQVKSLPILKNILKNCIGILDKQIINFLLNDGMPKLFESKTNSTPSINKLTLDPSKYFKMFSNEEQQIFSSCGIVAAGSSVLRCIINKNYKPNDIDLYINANNLSKLAKSKDIQIFSNIELAKSQYNMKNIIEVCEVISKVKLFDYYGNEKICKKKYQLIVVDTDPAEFIKYNFDFDLCAIGYNFATKTFVNYVEKPNYSVLTIQPSYINKMCGSDTDSYSEYRAIKTIGRIQKYFSRGFYVENWKEFLQAIRDNMCK